MPRIPSWRRYLRFWRSNVDADIAAELRFHLEERVEALMALRLPREEAERVAREEFGDAAAVHSGLKAIDDRIVARRQRRERYDVVVGDLRYAIRGLGRTPGFSAVVVLTLALGIGANAAIFSFLDRLFFRPPPGVVNPGGVQRLYRRFPADARSPVRVQASIPYAALVDIAHVLPAGALVSTYQLTTPTLGHGENAPPVPTVRFGPDYFRVLGVRPVIGRLPADDETHIDGATPIVLVSHEEWLHRYGGDTGIIGRVIELGAEHLTVIGVLPEDFRGVDVSAADYWAPLGTIISRNSQTGEPWYNARNTSGLPVLVRSSPSIRARIPAIATAAYRRGYAPHQQTTEILTGPILEALGPAAAPQQTMISTRLAGVALIVLLIACANVANLMLARGMRRRREIAVRVALGISGARLTLMLMTEGVLLALMAGIASLAVVVWGGEALRRTLMPAAHWPSGALDLRAALFAFGAALVAGIFAGLPTAFRVRSAELTGALRGGPREGTYQRSHLRSGLLVAQAAFAVLLLVGTGIFIQSLRHVNAIRLGYDTDHLLLVSILDDGREAHSAISSAAFQRSLDRLATIPGVNSVAATGQRLFQENVSSWLYDRDGRELSASGDDPTWISVSSSFFAVAGMRMLRGASWIGAGRDSAAKVIVVNDATARRFWPGENAVGQCLRVGVATASCSTVVGVVEDAHRSHLIESAPIPQFYIPLSISTPASAPSTDELLVRADPARLSMVAAAVRRELRAALPAHLAPNVRPMSDMFAQELRPWTLGAELFALFGALSLLVAAVGTYSTIAYAVSQRMHEMGVRVALGARPADILRLVVGGGVAMVSGGVLIGIGLVLALGRLVASLLYETTPANPAVIGIVAVTLLVVTVAASLGPAWRALRVDPVIVLREE